MRIAQKSTFLIARQDGQATTEYVLLIVVTLVLILALTNQIYRPFNKWLDNYMGSYLQCLLDAGELPDLGWGDGGICDADYKSFSLAEGRPLKEGAQNKGKNGSDEEKNTKKDALAGRSSAGGSGGGGSAGRPSDLSKKGFPIGGRTGADGNGDGNDKTQEIPNPLPQTKYMRTFNVGSSGGSGGKKVPVTGAERLLAEEREKVQRQQSRKQTISEEDEAKIQPKKFNVKKPERKIAKEDEEEPWSFGKFIKIAVIIMIIVAILLFLGGQALQISKGMEK